MPLDGARRRSHGGRASGIHSPAARAARSGPRSCALRESTIKYCRRGDRYLQFRRRIGAADSRRLSRCDALIFTEITTRSRPLAELGFRMVLSDEQVPRLCSSARGKSAKGEPWCSASRAPSAMRPCEFLKPSTREWQSIRELSNGPRHRRFLDGHRPAPSPCARASFARLDKLKLIPQNLRP